MFAIKSTRTGR